MVKPQNLIYKKKKINALMPGDIILHPIFRTDGLMLFKHYKVLSSDLINKIEHHIPLELFVIVAESRELFMKFIIERQYEDELFLKELFRLISEYSQFMTIPLDISSFLDRRVSKKSVAGKLTVNDKDQQENDYCSMLNKSPLFLNFENNFESHRLKERANLVRKKLLNMIEENNTLLSLLNQIISYKDILLLHSINAASLCLMIGFSLEMTDENLLDLVIASLFIELSLVQMPKEEFQRHLKNPEKQGEFYQAHLKLFKKVSNELPMIRKESILYGVFDHYEQYDGCGYPNGKSGRAISLFGRIISIAHTYDEMVGGYFYNDGIKPMETLKWMWKEKGKKFDPGIIDIFFNRTNYFKIGEPITLFKYGKGIIVGFEDFIGAPHLPMVQLNDGKIINLLKEE